MNEIKCTLYKILRCENISRNNIDETAKTLVLSDPDDLDECVFMNSSMFKKIFGRTWNSMSQKDRLLPIVKISYGNDCIYRRYRQCFCRRIRVL
jgi:hypothetical protein